ARQPGYDPELRPPALARSPQVVLKRGRSVAALVHSESSGPVVAVTLDSPANRNALSRRLVAELTEALSAAAAGENAHAVVLTHTRTPVCSGAALGQMRGGDPAPAGMRGGDPAGGPGGLLAFFRHLLTLRVRVVAGVDGAARAGGLGVLGACDVVLASTLSTFAFTEVRLGLAPAMISLPLRPL